eukprot:NODE_473_length_1445_cov_181.657593_g354_i0.p1 GENE.NODE_473_length_1445_cov_181.657593_g354_i0~~NODE_473_length_1445_cov_181.657593_g354_i0.p1  ORF type:complete len:423 (+),score=129.53 NODE_473_length_1445_cov_181.657593_g354_i0:29-1270(+)
MGGEGDEDEEEEDEKEAGPSSDDEVEQPSKLQKSEAPVGDGVMLPGDELKEGSTVFFETDWRKGGARVRRFEACEARSTLHIKSTTDYQGRPFTYDPLKDPPADQICFLPKKLLHTYRGHTKGVSRIEWFPRHGHLIMSAGMDGKVKLWDVMNSRHVIQTYLGHDKQVKDIAFNPDGERFVSSGYDRFIRLWDTETGQVIRTMSNSKIAYCLKFHPDEQRSHLFLAGCSDKKIWCWDTKSGKTVQEYDQHLGSVNTITFYDRNRKFVTTSDDKTIRVWEWDVPVQIKYIADPGMHSMPWVAKHPTDQYLAFQSLDNQILIYSVKEGKFKLQRKKKFSGHVNSGYAVQCGFSYDGRFLHSGDGDGNIWLWDWKTCRVLRKFKAHDSVSIGSTWHPTEQSKMATCGWDNVIKLWD